MRFNLNKLITTALFAAVVCVATMIIRIPTPGTNGYIHPGDAFVILSGIFLGTRYGFIAGGLGSAMADLLSGYFLYAPATFIIKGLISLCSGLITNYFTQHKMSRTAMVILCGLCDIVFVVGGYLCFEWFIYGSGALASAPANCIQGIGGLVIASILYPVLNAIPDVADLSRKFRK